MRARVHAVSHTAATCISRASVTGKPPPPHAPWPPGALQSRGPSQSGTPHAPALYTPSASRSWEITWVGVVTEMFQNARCCGSHLDAAACGYIPPSFIHRTQPTGSYSLDHHNLRCGAKAVLCSCSP